MLLTTCPNCAARFKVLPEQLNVRQGRVMCGRCRKVFNAFESLKRDESAQIVEEAYASDAEIDTPAPAIASSAITSSAFLTDEPAIPHELAAPVRHVSTGELEKGTFIAVHSEPVVAVGENDLQLMSPSLATPVENPLLLERRGRNATVSRAWGYGVAVAALLLAAQSLYYFRSAMVQQYPQLRPQFAAFCAMAGCSLPWGRDDDAIRVATSELLEMPGKPGRILLTATLINKGATRQDTPYLEVRLTDNANQVLVSRNLTPAQYLGRPVANEESIAPNAELFVNLNLDIANRPAASGYALRPFYP